MFDSVSDFILVITACGTVIHEVACAITRQKTLTGSILEKGVNLFKYFLDESKGSMVQKINMTFIFLVFLGTVAFLVLFFINQVETSQINSTLLVIFICFMLIFPCGMAWCEKFTRHRYPPQI